MARAQEYRPLRTCNKCGALRPLADYDRVMGRPWANLPPKRYLYGACKACRGDQIRALSLALIRRYRLEALEHYGGCPPKCSCCGENRPEFLQIDHVNGGGTKERKTRRYNHLAAWLVRRGFPDGFRVLCANCNMARSAYGLCPHEAERTDAAKPAPWLYRNESGAVIEDMADAKVEGRPYLCGERNGSRKLSVADVLAIRASVERSSVLTRRYGISRSLVSQVRRRYIWKHV